MKNFKTTTLFTEENKKEVKKAIRAPFSKIVIVVYALVITLLLIYLITFLHYETILVIAIITLYPLFFRLMSPYFRQQMLLSKLEQAKEFKHTHVEGAVFSIVTLFCDNNIEVRDSEEKAILWTLDYSELYWLIETDTYYALLPKARMGYAEWSNAFAVVDKKSIDDAGRKCEFIEMLNSKSKKLKSVKRK